ncbi:MAG: hypothetical protein NTV32_08860 [Gammaproteobacteria bacterium]|nr:hypothetical protein [Gammaproteobacteria bacterium]
MQDRSALFFKRENSLLAPLLSKCRGQLALIYGVSLRLDFQAIRMPFVFKAGKEWDVQQDVLFAPDEWPLPADFFDLIVLGHPNVQKEDIAVLIREAKTSLRQDGTLIVMGLSRGALKVLSALEQQGFACKVYRFHVCRCSKLNDILEKTLPFLSKGYVIEASIDSVSLTPLQEKTRSLLMERLLSTRPAIANNVIKQDLHEP